MIYGTYIENMSKNIEACFSHNTDDWRTPKNILLDLYFYTGNFIYPF